jgi:imidazolonepropionase
MFDRVIRNTSRVHTLEDAEGIVRGAIGVVGDRVAFVGPESELPEARIGPETQVHDAQGGFVGPGFVDPHTHVVFAGDRSREFEQRASGASYLDIAREGGGIANTMQAVRRASEAQLVELALPRLARMLAFGITTAEAKSGYGLNLEDELKMLRAIRTLNGLQPVQLQPSLLCAHAIPPEYADRREAYVDLCVKEIIPAAAEQQLAVFCDVFIEQGAFTLDEGRRILEAGLAHGLIPRLHADQMSQAGASRLAAELKASSADHLEHIDEGGMRAMAEAGVVAILVPASTLFLRQTPAAPGRALIEAGVEVALGTNVNPGSAMSENLALTLGLACLLNGLTAFEAYRAATLGAAKALRKEDRGRIRVDGPADLVIFSCADVGHLPYHLGINHVSEVFKGGRPVHRAPEGTGCRAA